MNRESKKGLVSVIMPVFNREHYVGDALDSILAQTYTNIEIIVVNDGSTDGSLDVLEDYRNRFSDKLLLINQKNQGQVVARNNGIAACSGEFIAFLDSDDLWLPEKLEKQIPLFDDNIGLVYSAVYNVSDNGEIIDITYCNERVRGNAYDQMLTGNKMTGGTVVLSRVAVIEVGLFDQSLSAAENWDLWIRVSKSFFLNYIDEPLVKYRKHDGNMSKDSKLMLSAIEQILNKHCARAKPIAAIESSCNEAWANYEYRKGLHHFAKHEYVSARTCFSSALQLQSDYKDARVRLFRTYLGKRCNAFLAAMKSMVST